MKSLLGLLAVAVIFFSTPTQSLELNASCNFKTSSMYYLVTGKTEITSINQSMTVQGGKTSEDTLSAKGSVRATNSYNWSHIFGDVWVGDLGELLTIDGWGKGFGTHSAVMQDTLSGFWVSTYIGECTGNFGGD